ncbi:MAG: ABC transporter permease [Angelakisella sp.]|nr:ABC transporter permease [Angelakisella sp.]
MKFKYASAPYLIWSIIFVVVPLVLVAVFAFTNADGQFTMENISKVSNYTAVFMRSIWLSVIATAICLLIGYPLAFIMSRCLPMGQRTLVMLIMLPMWINFLLRTYAWMTLLENNGIINGLLTAMGFEPLRMINTQGAVVLGMVYNYLPFMILPLYTIMTKISKMTIEAAQDLGANPFRVFSKVILPLSMPGVTTGITMVFVPSISTFIISRMLGGGSNMMVGDLIDAQFLGNAYNPNLGAAISLVLMVFILLFMSILNQFEDSEDKEGLMI